MTARSGGGRQKEPSGVSRQLDAEFAVSIDRECRDRTALMHVMNEQLGRTDAAF